LEEAVGCDVCLQLSKRNLSRKGIIWVLVTAVRELWTGIPSPRPPPLGKKKVRANLARTQPADL
jgi:hypothetical protein